MSFLGLCSYYRRFVPKFADIARPLHRLTHIDRPFEWSQEADESFDKLREALAACAALKFPVPNHPIEIHPDASDYGLGAVLVQRIDGVEAPIAYASRLLNQCERNYSITEKEGLAVLWALQKFKPYVWGEKITVITDHHGLCWLMLKHQLAGRLARWSLQVQEYDLTIVYKSGRLHNDADALSRHPVDGPEEMDVDYRVCAALPVEICPLLRHPAASSVMAGPGGISKPSLGECTVATILPTLATESLRANLKQAQRDIPLWRSHIERLEASNTKRSQNFELKKGLLCKRIKQGNKLFSRICIPPGKVRTEVMIAMHDDKFAGHLGVKRTLRRLRQRYFWPKMQRTVTKYVGSCPACQGRKGGDIQKAGRLQPMCATKPFQQIGMDILGPFKRSNAGNTNVIVAIDYFTKFAETKAIASADAQTIADFFVHQIILRHGAPEKLITDMGRCFVNRLLKTICRLMETNFETSSPYHPQTNGQVERLNRTLTDMLSMYVDHGHAHWDEPLPYVTFAYNTAVQESTQHSPYYLVHGREPRLPLDVSLGVEPNEADWAKHQTPGVLHRELSAARDWVKKHLPQVQRLYKARYDEGRVAVKYWPGDLVLRWKNIPKVGDIRKFQHCWFGPYEVIKQVAALTYDVKDCNSGRVFRSHVSLLKPYRVRINETMEEPVGEKVSEVSEVSSEREVEAEGGGSHSPMEEMEVSRPASVPMPLPRVVLERLRPEDLEALRPASAPIPIPRVVLERLRPEDLERVANNHLLTMPDQDRPPSSFRMPVDSASSPSTPETPTNLRRGDESSMWAEEGSIDDSEVYTPTTDLEISDDEPTERAFTRAFQKKDVAEAASHETNAGDARLIAEYTKTPEQKAILSWLLETDPNLRTELQEKEPYWWGDTLRGLRSYNSNGQAVIYEYPPNRTEHRIKGVSLRNLHKWKDILAVSLPRPSSGQTGEDVSPPAVVMAGFPDAGSEDKSWTKFINDTIQRHMDDMPPVSVASSEEDRPLMVKIPIRLRPDIAKVGACKCEDCVMPEILPREQLLAKNCQTPEQTSLLEWLLHQDPTLADELQVKDVVWRDNVLKGLRPHLKLVDRNGQYIDNLEQYPRLAPSDTFWEYQPMSQPYWLREFLKHPRRRLLEMTECSMDELVVLERARVLREWLATNPNRHQSLRDFAVRWRGLRSCEFDLVQRVNTVAYDIANKMNSRVLVEHNCTDEEQKVWLLNALKEDPYLYDKLQTHDMVWHRSRGVGLRLRTDSMLHYTREKDRGRVRPYPPPRILSLRVRARVIPNDFSFWVLGLTNPGLLEGPGLEPPAHQFSTFYPYFQLTPRGIQRDRIGRHHPNEYDPHFTLVFSGNAPGVPHKSHQRTARIPDYPSLLKLRRRPMVEVPRDSALTMTTTPFEQQTSGSLANNPSEIRTPAPTLKKEPSEEAELKPETSNSKTNEESVDLWSVFEELEALAPLPPEFLTPLGEVEGKWERVTGFEDGNLIPLLPVNAAGPSVERTPADGALEEEAIERARRLALESEAPPEQEVASTATIADDTATEIPVKKSKKGKFAKVFSALLFLSLVGFCSPAETNPTGLIERNGVYFKQGAMVSVGDSYWNIVTDLETRPVRDKIGVMEKRLRDPNSLLSSHNLTLAIKHRIQLSVNRANLRLAQASGRYDAMLGALSNGPRQKRSPLDGVGSTMKWLFGLATSDDVAQLNTHLMQTDAQSKEVLHLIAQQATIVNETLWETRRTMSLVKDLEAEIIKVETYVRSELGEEIAKYVMVDQFLDMLDAMVSWYEEYVDTLGIAITNLAQGRLSPLLFPPDSLRKVLLMVQGSLPRGWALGINLQDGELWRVYQDATTSSLITLTGMRLFVKIPIVETRHVLTLYQVFSLPISVSNGTKELLYPVLPDYLAASLDRQTFAELSKDDVGDCARADIQSCTVYTALNPLLSRHTCAIALFLDDEVRQREDCVRLTRPWSGHKSLHLGDGRWAYTARTSQRFTFSCMSPDQGPQVVQRTLPAWGLITAPDGCTVTTDLWSLPKKLRGRTEGRLNNENMQALETLTNITMGKTETSPKSPLKISSEQEHIRKDLDLLALDNEAALKANEKLADQTSVLEQTPVYTSAKDDSAIIAIAIVTCLVILIVFTFFCWKLKQWSETPPRVVLTPTYRAGEYRDPMEPIYDEVPFQDPPIYIRRVTPVVTAV